MKILLEHFFRLKSILTLFIGLHLILSTNINSKTLPFSTDSTNIKVWNGEKYVPLFIKGVNMGVAVPGTFPGEMAATSEQYARWFRLIRDAGFNTIRLYTLHFPRFYDELKKFNEANPQFPIYYFQGIWLEEDVVGYAKDLYSLTSYIDKETMEDINALHGNITIAERKGKAYGQYKTDASQWMIGYILGREIMPAEIIKTNVSHNAVNSFHGTYLSIDNTNASEAWLIERLDKLLIFEQDNYSTQRPVCVSSWPTLDPLKHPKERNHDEDTVSIDVSNVDVTKAKAGFFVSYHAYPYYPDFISSDSLYSTYSDYLGKNSYLGYLTNLKKHYTRFPLIIAEYGIPSSWGVAHYSSSGMNHGGCDEKTQGEYNIRLLENINTAKCGGGMQFGWIDEWFKRTWVTDLMDYDLERRILWQNVTAAEQNFGLIGFKKPEEKYKLIEEFSNIYPIKSIEAKTDFAYLKLKINMSEHIGPLDTIWLSLDTYKDSLGESILPNGKTVVNRAEFALMISNFKAELYVTQAYDLFGNWFHISEPEQLYHSTVTNGAPWKLVRWKNNSLDYEVQYIGDLRVNRLEMPETTMDGVRLHDDSIEIRLPWTLLNFVDPSQAKVMHDDKNTTATETMTSDGIKFGVFHKNRRVETSTRYKWELWNHALNVVEYKKESYDVIKAKLKDLPGNPIAVLDTFNFKAGEVKIITAKEGLLKNDLSLDGTALEAVLETNPEHGIINLKSDGSFVFFPEEGVVGEYKFSYRVKAGNHWSEPVNVKINILGTAVGNGFIDIFPNPSKGNFTIQSKSVIDYVDIYDVTGRRIDKVNVNNKKIDYSMPNNSHGAYFLVIYSGNQKASRIMAVE